MTDLRRRVTPAQLGRPVGVAMAAGTLLATSGLVAPAASAATPLRLVVHVGTSCSGSVLNTRSGTWVLSARHCGRVGSVTTSSGRRFTVRRVVQRGGNLTQNDVELVQVYGNIKSAVGGGFAVGRAPARGSYVGVHGYAGGGSRVLGCNGLKVSYHYGYPEVHNCYLPGGTSGGPWDSGNWVVRGVVGGIDGGGRTNYITNTIPFTSSVVNWVMYHAH